MVRSLVLLVAFLACGFTAKAGAFRLHIRKLAAYIRQGLPRVTPAERRELIEKLLVKAEGDKALAISSRDQALELLTSATSVGWRAWEPFEGEVAGILSAGTSHPDSYRT